MAVFEKNYEFFLARARGSLARVSSSPIGYATQKGLRTIKSMEDKNMITEIKSVEINETEVILEGIRDHPQKIFVESWKKSGSDLT